MGRTAGKAPNLATKPVEPGPLWDVQVDLVSETAVGEPVEPAIKPQRDLVTMAEAAYKTTRDILKALPSELKNDGKAACSWSKEAYSRSGEGYAGFVHEAHESAGTAWKNLFANVQTTELKSKILDAIERHYDLSDLHKARHQQGVFESDRARADRSVVEVAGGWEKLQGTDLPKVYQNTYEFDWGSLCAILHEKRPDLHEASVEARYELLRERRAKEPGKTMNQRLRESASQKNLMQDQCEHHMREFTKHQDLANKIGYKKGVRLWNTDDNGAPQTPQDAIIQEKWLHHTRLATAHIQIAVAFNPTHPNYGEMADRPGLFEKAAELTGATWQRGEKSALLLAREKALEKTEITQQQMKHCSIQARLAAHTDALEAHQDAYDISRSTEDRHGINAHEHMIGVYLAEIQRQEGNEAPRAPQEQVMFDSMGKAGDASALVLRLASAIGQSGITPRNHPDWDVYRAATARAGALHEHAGKQALERGDKDKAYLHATWEVSHRSIRNDQDDLVSPPGTIAAQKEAQRQEMMARNPAARRTLQTPQEKALQGQARELARSSRKLWEASEGGPYGKTLWIAHTWTQSAHLKSAKAVSPEDHQEAAQAHKDAAHAREITAEFIRKNAPLGTRAEVDQHVIKNEHLAIAEQHQKLAETTRKT